jgi:hypothetical protein
MIVPVIEPLPRSSLLRLRVRVTNVSGHELQLPRPCDRANPRVVVTNGHSIVEYDTVRTWPVARPCVARPPTRLAPGRSAERQNYVVLRGPVALPVIDVFERGRSVRLVGTGYRLAVRSQYLTPYVTALFVGSGREPIEGGRGDVPLYKMRRIASLAVGSRAPVIGPLVAIGSALCPGRRVLLPTWTVISRAHPIARIPAPVSQASTVACGLRLGRAIGGRAAGRNRQPPSHHRVRRSVWRISSGRRDRSIHRPQPARLHEPPAPPRVWSVFPGLGSHNSCF